MSTVATTNTDSIFIILDEGNDEGSEFALVPLATTRIVAHHGAARLMVIWRETGGGGTTRGKTESAVVLTHSWNDNH